MKKCCCNQVLGDNESYQYCKVCGVVQKGDPIYTPTGFHACPACGCPTVTQGQYCSVECAESGTGGKNNEELEGIPKKEN